MNQPATESDTADGTWSRRRWIFILIIALAIHFGFIFIAGARKKNPVRAVANVPQLQFAVEANEILALTDPTLFVRPHGREDFFPEAWQQLPAIVPPVFAHGEPAEFLPAMGDRLGEKFTRYLAITRYSPPAADLKPSPQLDAPGIVFTPALPQASTMQINGKLAGRELLKPVAVPTLAIADVLVPSHVQIVVDATGTVISAVLIEPGDSEPANQKALELARSLRFKPAAGIALGELIFHWHTTPPAP